MGMSKRIWIGLSSVALVGALAGCAPGEGPSAPQEASSLLDVQIPEDFTFATSRGLSVRATGDAVRIADTLAEVRLANGELVHKGPLTSPVELAVPTAAEVLQVTLRSPDGERVVEVAANGPEAVVAID